MTNVIGTSVIKKECVEYSGIIIGWQSTMQVNVTRSTLNSYGLEREKEGDGNSTFSLFLFLSLSTIPNRLFKVEIFARISDKDPRVFL